MEATAVTCGWLRGAGVVSAVGGDKRGAPGAASEPGISGQPACVGAPGQWFEPRGRMHSGSPRPCVDDGADGCYPSDAAADDLVDPADIPLCPEFERSGGCTAGDECPLVHGDQCEVGRRGCFGGTVCCCGVGLVLGGCFLAPVEGGPWNASCMSDVCWSAWTCRQRWRRQQRC
jgi:hypothetical protein